MNFMLFLQHLHFSLLTIFEFTATFFVISLSKYGGSAFNWAHDFADFPIPIEKLDVKNDVKNDIINDVKNYVKMT